MTEITKPGIFVIEDDPNYREALFDSFKRNGLTITGFATSMPQALEAIPNFPSDTGIVTLDTRLWEGDKFGVTGRHVLKELRKQRPDLFVISLSTSPISEADLILDKMVGLSAIAQAIKGLISKSPLLP